MIQEGLFDKVTFDKDRGSEAHGDCGRTFQIKRKVEVEVLKWEHACMGASERGEAESWRSPGGVTYERR